MSHYLIEQLAGDRERRTCTPARTVAEAHGDDHLEAGDPPGRAAPGSATTYPASHLFVFIGGAPAHRLAGRRAWSGTTGASSRPGRALLDDGRRPHGWALDRDPYFLESSVPGVFVAGDVRAESVKRVASAVGEGAMAVTLVHRYLGER